MELNLQFLLVALPSGKFVLNTSGAWSDITRLVFARLNVGSHFIVGEKIINFAVCVVYVRNLYFLGV